MLGQFLENLNKNLKKINFFLEKNKDNFIFFIFFVSVLYVLSLCFGITIQSLENFLKFSINDYTNIYFIFLKGGFFYII